MKKTFFLLLSLLAVAVNAQDLTTFVYFAAVEERLKYKVIRVEFQVDEPPTAASACGPPTDHSCVDRYWLQQSTGTPVVRVYAEKVALATSVSGFTALDLTFKDAPASLKDLVVVLAGMIDKDGKPMPHQTFSIAPQLSQDDFTDSIVLTYQALEPQDLSGTDLVKVKITAKDKDKKEYPVRITSIHQGQRTSGLLHSIVLDTRSVPRGVKLKTTIEGLERFNGEPIAVEASVARAGFPKGRDDARFYTNIAVEGNAVKGERAYKYDMLVAPKFNRGLWEHGPKLDLTVGNKTSKAPNTAAASWEFRYFIPSVFARLETHQVTGSPIYRTDRESVNREAGVDLLYEPFFRVSERGTLEQRRIDAKLAGKDPKTLHWGWRVRPAIAFEGGTHLENASAEVDGTAYNRLRGTVVALVEREKITLTLTGTTRRLFSDEAVVEEETVIKTGRSDQNFFRADLAYDFGPFALTLTHMNGRQPPSFSATHSTALGLTWKF